MSFEPVNILEFKYALLGGVAVFVLLLAGSLFALSARVSDMITYAEYESDDVKKRDKTVKWACILIGWALLLVFIFIVALTAGLE